MFIEKLENKNMFEVGAVYSYAFACDSDSYHSMQVVSISDTRKTAMICDYYGKDVDPKKASRKKIDTSYSGDCEAISAGRYSMAGSWYATERSYSKRRDDFGIKFMLETETADDLKHLLHDFPTDNNSIYTVKIDFWVNDVVIRDFPEISLAAAVDYLNNKADMLSETYGKKWHIGYTVNKNGSAIDGDFTPSSNPAGLLDTIERNSAYYGFEEEYFNMLMTCGAEVLPSDVMEELAELAEASGLEVPNAEAERRAEITMTTTDEPDPDPDNDPSGKPDENTTYSNFDNDFRTCNIISVSFGGVSNSAEPAERAKKTNRKKKLTEKEWKKQLEMKADFEAAEKATKLEKISAQLRNAQIGDTIIDLSTPEIIEHITSIDREDCDDEPEYFVIKTDYNNVYEGFDFFDDCTTGEPATVIFATSSEPEQADPEQLTIEEVTTYSANEADTEPENVEVPAPVSPLIDEEAAKRGKESYSFSDYTPGSATTAYNAQVAKMRAAAEEQKKQVPEEFHSELDKLVNRYAVKLADWTNRKNRCDASYPSWAIAGPANYNMRKHEKQMNRLDSLFTEYNEKIVALENKIENFAYTVKHRPIMDGDENALEKLREKVAELTEYQECMKQENAEARKAGKDAPYPTWELSNNRQNLKRYEDRLKSLEKAKAAPTCEVESVSGDGFKIVRNSDIMRLQFLFDSKPDEETRNVLKKNGFKWAPSQKAWQRQLNRNGEFAAKRVLAEING